MLEWLRGRSSKFYRDTIKILRPPSPPPPSFYQAEDNEIMTTNYDKS